MRRLFTCFMLGAALLAGGLAGGKPPPAAAKLFNECIAALDAGKLPAARDCFERVYELYPSPVVVYNLAQTNEALGRMVEAFDGYQRCAASAGGALTDDELADVGRRRDALAKGLAFIKVRREAPGLAVQVGGQPRAASSPRGIAVVPGTHEVRVTATGMKPWTDRVRVKAGETREVRPVLAAETVPKAATAQPASQPSTGSVPLPVRQMRGAQNMRVEILLEKALDSQASRTASAEERAAAWCSLAEVAHDNPYREGAATRCLALRKPAEDNRRRRAALEGDLKITLEFLALKRKTAEEKAEAVRAFLVTHYGLAEPHEYDSAVRRLLGRASEPVCREICSRVQGLPLPTMRNLKVQARYSTGGMVRGRVFIDGVEVGVGPGSFDVSRCATKIGISNPRTGGWWESALKPDCAQASTSIVAEFRRFHVQKAGSVVDAETRLTWQRRAPERPFELLEARDYCAALGLDGGGWRVPSASELTTLVVQGARPTIDAKSFPDTPEERFWTTTQLQVGWNLRYAVSFLDGKPVGAQPDTRLRVRCVR